jgi:hypothetical protein
MENARTARSEKAGLWQYQRHIKCAVRALKRVLGHVLCLARFMQHVRACADMEHNAKADIGSTDAIFAIDTCNHTFKRELYLVNDREEHGHDER